MIDDESILLGAFSVLIKIAVIIVAFLVVNGSLLCLHQTTGTMKTMSTVYLRFTNAWTHKLVAFLLQYILPVNDLCLGPLLRNHCSIQLLSSYIIPFDWFSIWVKNLLAWKS
jgi:hypothetical protein